MLRRLLIALLGLGAIVPVVCYRSAIATPTVRRAAVSMPGWPDGTAPVTIALVSDIHVGNSTMDAPRLTRIVAQVNALHPDLIVLAGDFVATEASSVPVLATLRGLRAPLGTIAVLGNHDHWTSAVRIDAALERAGVTVLTNGAVRRGPLAIGGIDDLATRHADLPRTLAAMRRAGGAGVLVSHSPDIAPRLHGGLVLAGHTHCGQIVLPWYGPPVDVSRYGARYRCGMIREGGRTTIVTAGVGTSVLPFRFGAPPDIWLVRVGR